ncbi:hypothetical protein EYF80_010661 [Liparis tanakae]|uniref:Uncharacterized protein n=1 Tax=Liparis tanakae TaxID=230148 RepID=A0A4Z2IP34_9TELE|nr:hypothetical protein EYF80_010661 [Liparis tanakae]
MFTLLLPTKFWAKFTMVIMRACCRDRWETGDISATDPASCATFTSLLSFLFKQGENSVAVAPDDSESGDGQRLGRVSLGEDEGAFARVFSTCDVGCGDG